MLIIFLNGPKTVDSDGGTKVKLFASIMLLSLVQGFICIIQITAPGPPRSQKGTKYEIKEK